VKVERSGAEAERPSSWSRRRLLRAGALGGLGAIAGPMLKLGRCRLLGQGSPAVSTRAADLVLAANVVDMLGLLTLDWQRFGRWQQAADGPFGEGDYRHLVRSGVRVFHPAVDTHSNDPHAAALRWIGGWNRLFAATGCYLGRVTSINDLGILSRQGRLGVVVGFQNSDHFRTVADVGAFQRLGQRVSQLTYNETNRLGDGCYKRPDRGLTEFGAEVVAEMNRVGMAVDISHCGDRTSLDAVAASRAPVLVTHSNCRALVPAQPRCKPDSVIRAVAAQGGVFGITTVRAFVGHGSPSIKQLLDHFDHVAREAGVEHVGIGSDYEYPGPGEALRSFYAIRGLEPGLRIFQIADGLLARGWSGRHVELALGGNFERVLGEIWPRPTQPVVPVVLLERDPFCPPERRTAPTRL
jgi:membrane dipeptidase